MSTKSPLRPDPNPTRDFFFQDLLDVVSARDAGDAMLGPMFHLSKNKRNKPLEYKSPDGRIWVRILAQPEYGMANIWDFDVMIYLISRIANQIEKGVNANALPDTVLCTPSDILRNIARGTGGKDYKSLMDALNRLKNTTVETNIRAVNKTQVERFNWISNYGGAGASADHLNSLSITLPRWLLEGIRAGNVLSIDREYFLLTGGLEKALYRLARKHAGAQPDGFLVRLSVLAGKVGSDSSIPLLKNRLNNIAKQDHLPRYAMTMTTTRKGEDAVHFVDRRFEDEGRARKRREAAVKKHRAYARTAWIDANRDPREFEEAYEVWNEAGNDPSKFADHYTSVRLI